MFEEELIGRSAKKILTASLAAAMVFSMVGCGGEQVDTTPEQTMTPPPAETQEQTHTETMPDQMPAEASQDAEETEFITMEDANEELKGKLRVAMDLEPYIGEEGKQKAVFTFRNTTNEELEYAGIYIILNSESKGRLFKEFYTIENLAAWRATTAVEIIDDADDVEFLYMWSDNYVFAEPEDEPAAKDNTENTELSTAFYNAVKSADYVDWGPYLVSAKCYESGDKIRLVLTFTHGVDDIADAKPLGFESVASGAGLNGFGGVFPSTVVLQYEDGSIITEKNM